jgi:hypothetical protein
LQIGGMGTINGSVIPLVRYCEGSQYRAWVKL